MPEACGAVHPFFSSPLIHVEVSLFHIVETDAPPFHPVIGSATNLSECPTYDVRSLPLSAAEATAIPVRSILRWRHPLPCLCDQPILTLLLRRLWYAAWWLRVIGRDNRADSLP